MARTARQQVATKKAQAVSAAKRKVLAASYRLHGQQTFASRMGNRTFASHAAASAITRRTRGGRDLKRANNQERAAGAKWGAEMHGQLTRRAKAKKGTK